MELGADDFLFKPRGINEVRGIADDLLAKVRHLVSYRPVPRTAPVMQGESEVARRLVMIGSSAGGPQQLDSVLSELAPDLDAAVIVTQHMPVGFTAALVERFRRLTALPIAETASGDQRFVAGPRFEGGFHTVVTGSVDPSGRRSGKIVHTT